MFLIEKKRFYPPWLTVTFSGCFIRFHAKFGPAALRRLRVYIRDRHADKNTRTQIDAQTNIQLCIRLCVFTWKSFATRTYFALMHNIVKPIGLQFCYFFAIHHEIDRIRRFSAPIEISALMRSDRTRHVIYILSVCVSVESWNTILHHSYDRLTSLAVMIDHVSDPTNHRLN